MVLREGMFRRFKDRASEPIPLGHCTTTPGPEKLPEPEWITVSKEEYDRMFNAKIPDAIPEIEDVRKQYYINFQFAMKEMEEILQRMRECVYQTEATSNLMNQSLKSTYEKLLAKMDAELKN